MQHLRGDIRGERGRHAPALRAVRVGQADEAEHFVGEGFDGCDFHGEGSFAENIVAPPINNARIL